MAEVEDVGFAEFAVEVAVGGAEATVDVVDVEVVLGRADEVVEATEGDLGALRLEAVDGRRYGAGEVDPVAFEGLDDGARLVFVDL